MPDVALLLLLFAIGVLALLAEVFLPSYGLLSVVGLGFLIAGIVHAFSFGRPAGVASIVLCLVFVPSFAWLSVKFFHRTPLGKKLAPPNPELTSADSPVRIDEISQLVGRDGQSVSPLRPVGVCEFDGKRVTCIAQFGMIEADRPVEAVGISGMNLAVAEKTA